jgi:uncharacterized repeat protein (TIGR01451 family)
VVATVTKAGTERNTAEVKSASDNPHPKRAVSSATTRIRPVLDIAKTASTQVARPGGNVIYMIRITNPMAITAHHVTACDELPRGLIYVRSAPTAQLNDGAYCWTPRALAAHHTTRYTITTNASLRNGGKLTNRATVTAPGARTHHAAATITVTPTRPVRCMVPSLATGKPDARNPTAKAAC